MKRTWIGKYYDNNGVSQEDEFPFKIEVLIDSDLSFTGNAWEEEFYSLSQSMIDVRGFINEGHINFIKKYPFRYEVDENDKPFVDKSEAGHEVQYDGYWNNDLKKWEGEWEVSLGIINEKQDSYTEEVIFGKFEMK